VPSQIKTDDCAVTARHYQAVREMMAKPAPPGTRMANAKFER
jgi:hypothetical protein